MTLEQIKDWLKGVIDVGDGIAVGSIDGTKERFIGVYLWDKVSDRQRICIGGTEATVYQIKALTILIHWTMSAVQAESKAQEIYQLLYGSSDLVIEGTQVYFIDPGAGPIQIGKDENGIYEFIINARITYKRRETI